MKKVFIVTWWFDAFGGMEEHITQLACALARRDIHVIVFSEMPVPRRNGYRVRLEAAGIKVIGPPRFTGLLQAILLAAPSFLKRLGHSFMGTVGRFLRRRLKSAGISLSDPDHWLPDLHALEALERECRDGLPDAVHVHAWRLGQTWVARWAAQKSVPCLYTEHSTIMDWGGPAAPEATQILLDSNATISCISSPSAESLRRVIGNDVAIAVVPHVISGSESSPGIPHEQAGAMRLFSPARLQYEKGTDVLLNALALVLERGDNVSLKLAGEGPYRGSMEALAKKLRLSDAAEFLGRVDRERMPELFDASDVVVIASRTEGLPVALVEAMAHGKPVIATRVGGVPDLVQPGVNGMLVPPEDPHALATAIGELVLDSDKRRALAQGARRSFGQSIHNEANAVAAVIALYSSTARGSLAAS